MATLNPALRDFWAAVARYRVLFGGRDSTKSWDAAGMAVFLAQKCKVKIMCTRQFQNRIEESVYTLLITQINRFGLASAFTILKNKIICNTTGSEFLFYGLWRHIEEIKSTEGVDILWIEEGHALTDAQMKILKPTIRKEASQIWLIFNPRFANDYAYQSFVVDPPKNSVIRKINYDENQFLSDTSREEIEELKAKDYEEYLHVYEGMPKTDDDKVIIKRQWLEAAIDAHLKIDEMEGRKVLGYDVADSGQDKNATALMDGSILRQIKVWQGGENELKKSADKVRLDAVKFKASIIYDSIGVGAHTGSTLQAAGFGDFARFNAGAKVIRPNSKYNGIKNKDYFSNLKAQAWWQLADKCRNTHDYIVNGNENYKPDELISFDSKCKNLDAVITQLSTPYKDFDKLGRVKVESKDDLKARLVKSPNEADSVIMAVSRHLTKSSKLTDLTISGF